MAWLTRSYCSRILTVALALGLAVELPATVQAQLTTASLGAQLPETWEFQAPSGPDSPLPVNREAGGKRDIADAQPCVISDQPLTAIVPTSGLGTTVAEYPTVFWYMPKTRASGVEFVLADTKNREIYRVNYALDKSAEGSAPSGIMSLPLPTLANFSPLKIGQNYRWQLALVCDANSRDKDVVASGWIQRVSPSPNLALRVKQANPQERVTIYANERLWYETLITLNQLRRDFPKDRDLEEAWKKLLKSVGLDKIAQENSADKIVAVP